MPQNYLSERRRKELAMPVSIVRRCFIRMVLGSTWDGEGECPAFEAVAGGADIAIHDALLRAEFSPFDGLGDRTKARLHRSLLLAREDVCRPYEKTMLLVTFMAAIGVIARLTQEDRLRLDPRSELAEVLEHLCAFVRDLCPKEWDSFENGAHRTAGFFLEALAKHGYRYDATAEVDHAA